MSRWEIERVKETDGGLRVDFVLHSDYVGEPSQRIAGIFTKWVTINDVRPTPTPEEPW